MVREYIIVDDDPINNAICRMMIKRTLGEVEIKMFELPEEGLAFIEFAFEKNLHPAILFLDINMPTLSGWEFMEEFEKFSEEVKRQINIYIVSSSVDQRDRDKAKSNKNIKGFVSKPLTGEMIRSLACM